MFEENIYTAEIDGRVHIRMDMNDKIPIRTVPQFLNEAANLHGNSPALSWRQDGENSWKHFTYKQYENEVRTCAKAFLNLGLERHHTVCILGCNSPEWFISDLAAIYAGGIAAGIYATNLPDACHHCCLKSKANIVVVGDEQQLEKILQIRDRLPLLKAIIQISGIVENHPNVYSWRGMMGLGKSLSDNNLDTVIQTIVPNECCTLVFTSGTTDNPKAVMLSHDNLIYEATIVTNYIGSKEDLAIVVSFLPLSHVAAQVVDIYSSIYLKAHCYFADKNALKGSLLNTLLDVKPTHFFAVPRVWEKIYIKMRETTAASGFLKKKISTWALAQGLNHTQDIRNERSINRIGYTLANVIVFKHMKKALGLSRCEYFLSAAAPLSLEIKTYFSSLNIRILEAFGMSESSGAHTINTNTYFRLDGVGKTIPNTQTKINNPDESGIGEIFMKGRNIFMGYLDNWEKTIETIDEEGWLHSGDLGTIDKDGFVHITGRIKELIITAGGENVSPTLIENNVKAELPHISNAVVVGDNQKFISVLITLKTKTDVNGTPLDILAPETIKWLRYLGCHEVSSLTDLIENPEPNLLAAIQKGLEEANKKAISHVQQVKQFAILPQDFSMATGELGPTLKLKRHVVYKKYAKIIEIFIKIKTFTFT